MRLLLNLLSVLQNSKLSLAQLRLLSQQTADKFPWYIPHIYLIQTSWPVNNKRFVIISRFSSIEKI